MRALKYKKIPDRSNLTALTSHYTVLSSINSQIKTAYRNYILNKGLPSLPPIAVSNEQKSAFLSAYENRPKAANLEWIDLIYYNGLESCPFCGGDGARTIEHYLPKTSYPEFSVYSVNLMPSCGSCNTKRNDINEYGAAVHLLHPFFDIAILDKIDLFINIQIQHGIPEFSFLRYDPTDLDDDEICRIDHHIDSSIDEVSYFNKCHALISEVRGRAKRWQTVEEFRHEVVTYEFYLCKARGEKNSWRYAFYSGLNKLENDDLAALVDDVLGTGAGW